MRPGAHNDLTDVAGIRVGHATRLGGGWATGCTVVLPDRPAVCGVSVRGGGPGTRETDLLDPRNLVDRVDAVVLAGGSAFGLRTADGVMDALADQGRGWPMGPPGAVVPIVPAAILFDLGRAGVWDHHLAAADGAAAFRAATTPAGQGCVGAGAGAVAGGLKSGIGSASVVLADGTTVAALVACNAVGSPIDPSSGELWSVAHGLPGEFDALPPVDPERLADFHREREAEFAALSAGMATTIGVVATDASLTKAECAKLADVAHDGIARAVDPVHTAFDGDTLFAMATGERPRAGDPVAQLAVAAAAGRCVTRAIGHALLAATTLDARETGGEYRETWRERLTQR